jgi:dipeptidyl aminopeptidase/acylaminoacyl peptidase
MYSNHQKNLMMSKFYFLLCCCLSSVVLFGQSTAKKMLLNDDIAQWRSIEKPKISNDGRWVLHVERPTEGDHELKIYDSQAGKAYTVARGEQAAFSADSRFAAFIIKPQRDSILKLRRKKTKKEDLTKDSLGIYDLERMQLTKIPAVKSFRLPEKWNNWLVYHLEPAKVSPKDTAAAKLKKENEDNGSKLGLFNLQTRKTQTIGYVKSYTVAEEAARIAWHTAGDGKTQTPGVYIFDGGTGKTQAIWSKKGLVKQLALDKPGNQAAFVFTADSTKAPVKAYALCYWKNGQSIAQTPVETSSSFLPKQWLVSENAALSFAKDGSKLFFGIAPYPVLQDTSLLEDEIVSVEVWSTQDKQIFPQQKVRLEQEKKRAYDCVFHTATGKLVQLGNMDVPEIRYGNEGNASFALGYTDAPYAIAATWLGGSHKDLYLVDVTTGKKEKIATNIGDTPAWSPLAKYIYWYADQDSAWYAYRLAKKDVVKLTNNKKTKFYDELNDSPDFPNSYGIAGWTTEDDFVMVYDRYDIWLIDPTQQLAATNLTNSRGEKTTMRYIKTDPEERSIEEVKPLLIHFTKEDNLNEGYLWYEIHTGHKRIVQEGPYAYATNVLKAKNAERWVFTREDFQTFPDLQYSPDLVKMTSISQANPQQANYRWGTNELVEWVAADGQKLRGILIKPEGFDPQKQYPMVVYFYERMSQQLHTYYSPTWNRSMISFPAFASRGYLIFIPDIPYRIGFPGESARNSIVSGVTNLISKGFVDKSNIGLQGHSWGGYQIAYLVTQTNLFKCAESGAPVVNMVSAYGGIRWETGISRQFQYEHTQSRIGGTLWEKPLRYIENSPIFFADKIETPLLIMHNDKDGAVPWYQGIEFYMALRRLGKPAWLLNYNEEGHGLTQLRNRKDFQLRMGQFFDHYLKGAPKPKWMENGVPAIEKGIRQGYELTEK